MSTTEQPAAPAAPAEQAQRITTAALTHDETIPSRSRTYSPEVVKAVWELLNPPEPAEGEEAAKPVKNVGVGSFDSEGQARSALHTLNRMLKELHDAPHTYAGTVREQEDGKFRAIVLNKPAKAKAAKVDKPADKPTDKPAAKK